MPTVLKSLNIIFLDFFLNGHFSSSPTFSGMQNIICDWNYDPQLSQL